jgi:hypothetical protein
MYFETLSLIGVKRKRLLEIGSRPTLHMVMSAAKWFDEIILSDFAPLKIRGELRCSGRVSSSCSTTGTRRVKLVTIHLYILLSEQAYN